MLTPDKEQTYSKHSMPVLRVDARFTVIEACLKGYTKWRKHHKDEPDHVSPMSSVWLTLVLTSDRSSSVLSWKQIWRLGVRSFLA